MADDISSGKLPLSISRGLFAKPPIKELPLTINRRLGSLDSYTYVYAGKLPLRIESRINQGGLSSALPLAIIRPHATILPARYVSSKALPLSINTPISEQPLASRLPLAIKTELSTLPSVTGEKPKAQYINPNSWQSSEFGNNALRHLDQKIAANGFESLLYGTPAIRVDIAEGFFPSSRLKLPIAVSTSIRPPSSQLPLNIYRQHGEWLNRPDVTPTNRRYVYPKTFIDGVLPTPNISLYKQYVLAGGINSLSYGSAIIKNAKDFIVPKGWQSSTLINSGSIVNRNKNLIAQGFEASLFGSALTYNSKQFAPLQGKDQSSYGIAYVQGGVKHLLPRSYYAAVYGRASVVNTTASQQVLPKGIEHTLVVPAPIVSPHMIYARGIYGTLFGSVKVIPTPVLRHKGVNHFEAGKTTVWYHTRPLSPNGFESYDTGYPKVFDPTQYFSPSPTLRSSVFGDVRIRNNNSYLRAPSIDSQAISEWATVEARDKTLYAKSFVAQAFGDQLIKNKSPSIFFNGLPAPIFYNQAIGYRIRAVAPTGFDRLGLGKPTVIKTPELFPRSYVATQFGTQWVSNYTRYIDNNSKDHSSVGKPTAWFRYRYADPSGWQSSKFSNTTTLTHGVRELIGQGFIQQGYGTAWLSRGVRLLEPLSIVKKQQASNHFVGRHQEIKPIGYIATQFGTRIIPEIQAVYPLGFAGVFGLAVADLYTRHLKPKGYSTAGDQQSLRWGRQIVQNSVQYITQNFDGGNGLVPPKWSDWTAIENRNKVIGAIGTPMQKFGYAQIDNHARLLEPQGLIATRFNQSMIAYRIRYLPIQGIEQPYMSDWLVVHNAARVIKPAGEVQTLFGDAELVKTRRYLDRIGRIESQAFGLGMIAYRIRTLDIEKRYSIAPPIIQLPTVDLYTRYVEFNGYETAKYGLASLSIHFRIITPRWTHREKIGSPALRNVTPELQTKGHDSQEYGNASIRTQWREVYAQGDDTSVIGLLEISDTKQHISVRGFLDGLASQRHTVTQGESAPYSLQYVYLNDENNSSQGSRFGIAPPKDQVPEAYLNQNVIYTFGNVSSSFGTQFVWGNNLTIDGGIGVVAEAVPEPVVANKNNVLNVTGIDNTIGESRIGKPRLSPHTIYAVMEAPQQAKGNHPVNNLHYVNSTNGTRKVGEVFGSVKIESTIRTIRPSWSLPSSYYSIGSPSLALRLSVIKPNGFRLGQFGTPSIPFTPQAIEIRLGIYANIFGGPVVKRPPYIGPQYISLQGIYSTVFGATYADNYVRTLYARGGDSLEMGQRKNGDTPYMWQGLRVGEHVPLIIGGGDMSRHGLTWISLRVRELGAEGFDTFRSEYDITDFNGKMTVKNADKKLPSQTIVTAIGVEPYNAFGYQNIKLGQHYIRPDGNSDQFRKGGYHA